MAENASPTNLGAILSRISDYFTSREPRIAQLEQAAAETAGRIAKLEADLTQAKADLETARTTIGTLTAERDQAKTEAASATKALADIEPEVNRRANILAGERLAGVGVRAVAEDTKLQPNQSGSLFDQYHAATGAERERLYLRIRKEAWGKD